MKKLILTFLALLTLSGLVAGGHTPSDTYQQTRQLLSDSDVTHPNEAFARLYEIGDERIGDLIRALNDDDREISRRAQEVIRYLANPEGMKALHNIFAHNEKVIIAGTVPPSLDDWDYKFIRLLIFEHPQEHWSQLEFNYVSALVLDGSPRAGAMLTEIGKTTVVNEAKKFYRIANLNSLRDTFSDEADLSRLVLQHAFFVDSEDRKYTSARLAAMNGAKTKAFVEVYINRGVLAEEWWHVVIDKKGNRWRFATISLAAVS